MRNRAELEIANRDSFILGPYGGKYGGELWKREHPQDWKEIQARYGQGNNLEITDEKLRKKRYWKSTKWYPVEGIGLLNGGACNQTFWHRRGFLKRIEMMREYNKI